jgi:uncharacterized protein with HEPN domain
MTGGRHCQDYLRDMADAVGKALDFVGTMSSAEFAADAKTVFAVVRALEVLREAAKSVPGAVRNRFPDVPWQSMATMRDKLIHAYFGVNRETVWRTVREDLPGLRGRLDQIADCIAREERVPERPEHRDGTAKRVARGCRQGWHPCSIAFGGLAAGPHRHGPDAHPSCQRRTTTGGVKCVHGSARVGGKKAPWRG